MAKTAILMPYPELLELAGSLVPEYPRLAPMCIEHVSTSRVRARARAPAACRRGSRGRAS